MFDFEKLLVYQKAKRYYHNIQSQVLCNKEIDPILRNQLRRSSSSIVLNIAEGSSRFSNADKRNFYIIARGSVFETVATLDLMKEEKKITAELYHSLYSPATELSRILYTLIGKLCPAAHVAEKQ